MSIPLDKNGLPDFEAMIDNYMYLGWDVKRENGVAYVFMNGEWVPFRDWHYGSYDFGGARNLIAFARHFFVKGMQAQKEHEQAKADPGEL